MVKYTRRKLVTLISVMLTMLSLTGGSNSSELIIERSEGLATSSSQGVTESTVTADEENSPSVNSAENVESEMHSFVSALAFSSLQGGLESSEIQPLPTIIEDVAIQSQSISPSSVVTRDMEIQSSYYSEAEVIESQQGDILPENTDPSVSEMETDVLSTESVAPYIEPSASGSQISSDSDQAVTSDALNTPIAIESSIAPEDLRSRVIGMIPEVSSSSFEPLGITVDGSPQGSSTQMWQSAAISQTPVFIEESSSDTTESSDAVTGEVVTGNGGATPTEASVTPAGSESDAVGVSSSAPEVQPTAVSTEAPPATQDPCADVVCSNGGTCGAADGGGILCLCVDGWTGEYCAEEINECSSNPCHNNATCMDLLNGFNCTCPLGYTDDLCKTDIDECSSNPCQNNATCKDQVAGFTCSCAAGYDGTLCDNDINECEASPCLNNGTCNDMVNSFSCSCAAGYTGETCDRDIDECEMMPCMNGGTCSDLVAGYECACVSGYNGSQCENNIDECAPMPCQNDGTCVDGINQYSCNCTMHWTGETCTEDVDECTDGVHMCDTNAECNNTLGNYTCTCLTGYMGNGYSCSFIDLCAELSPCNKGYCTTETMGYNCMCFNGWTGVNCTDDIDECLSPDTNDCDSANGECTNTDGGFTCQCVNGTIGDGKSCKEVILYPDGSTDQVGPNIDDGILEPKTIEGGLPFFGKVYHGIQVSINGYITLTERYAENNMKLARPPGPDYKPNVPMLFPFWSDLDLSNNTQGKVSYVDRPSVKVVIMATSQVRSFSEIEDFKPKKVIVITWSNMTAYPASMYAGKQSVTFQVVLVTDGTQSFAIYNYDKSTTDWSAVRDNEVWVGYTDGGEKSWIKMMNSSMMPYMDSNIGKPGRYMFKLGDPIENEDEYCLDWIANQNMDSVMGNKSNSDPCPCTMDQTKLDGRFVMGSSPGCYISRHGGMAKQTCCYHSSAELQSPLMVGYPGGGHLVLDDSDVNTFQMCCTERHLCEEFYSVRPSDSCETYETPHTAYTWGFGQFLTFDGNEYTFNGYGEFMLLNFNNSELVVEARMQKMEKVREDTSIFTMSKIVMIGAKTTRSKKIGVQLLEGSTSLIDALVDGVSTGDIEGTQTEEDVQIDYIHPNSFRLQFDMGIGITVTYDEATTSLGVSVMIPKSLSSLMNTKGLLGSANDIVDDDFALRNGTILHPDTFTSMIDYHHFGIDWLISEDESVMTYNDFEKSFSDYQDPDFEPSFINPNSTLVIINATTKEMEACNNNDFCRSILQATGDTSLATSVFDHYKKWVSQKALLANKPPMFEQSLPKRLEANIGQAFSLSVTAKDSDASEVTVKIMQDIVDGYTFDGTTFTWTPSEKYMNTSMSVSLTFVARDSQGMERIYTPVIHMCACGDGQCKREDKMDAHVITKQYWLGKCICQAGKAGPLCTETMDMCSPVNPCYMGGNCTSTPGKNDGFQCAACPNGYKGGGYKCYEMNECLTGQNDCSQLCMDTLESYTCSCREGYQLKEDRKTCEDIDECLGKEDLCPGVGMYCSNTVGSYKCMCMADFFMEDNVCKEGPKRFGGQMKFKLINLGAMGVTEYMPEMADSDSEEFNMVADVVENQMDTIYSGDFQGNYIGAQVYNISKGSILTQFNLFFTDNSTVDPGVLEDTLRTYLTGAGCQEDGADCQVGNLVGVDVTASRAGAKDRCAFSADNDCDQQSTQCSSPGDGTFYCSCKAGFRRWLDLTNICQDINECTENPTICDTQSSTCVNLPGSYQCRCLPGFIPHNGVCKDVCNPNPCKNDGKCVASANHSNAYTCECDGIYDGLNCEDENDEASKLRLIAIVVGTVLGAAVLLLLLILCAVCLRRQSDDNRAKGAKNTYSTQEFGSDNWMEPNMVAHGQIRTNPQFEMRENGSKQNLLNTMPETHSTFTGTTNAEGVQNPAYSNANESKTESDDEQIDKQYF